MALEFTSPNENDPDSAFSSLIDLVSPTLASFRFAPEANGKSWAHWTCGFENVVRGLPL
jgi:hypothetical protein